VWRVTFGAVVDGAAVLTLLEMLNIRIAAVALRLVEVSS
jgi:hypothetical protein